MIAICVMPYATRKTYLVDVSIQIRLGFAWIWERTQRDRPPSLDALTSASATRYCCGLVLIMSTLKPPGGQQNAIIAEESLPSRNPRVSSSIKQRVVYMYLGQGATAIISGETLPHLTIAITVFEIESIKLYYLGSLQLIVTFSGRRW